VKYFHPPQFKGRAFAILFQQSVAFGTEVKSPFISTSISQINPAHREASERETPSDLRLIKSESLYERPKGPQVCGVKGQAGANLLLQPNDNHHYNHPPHHADETDPSARESECGF
jgi:hypothetical protein